MSLRGERFDCICETIRQKKKENSHPHPHLIDSFTGVSAFPFHIVTFKKKLSISFEKF
jgi:hypothetical protein